MTDIFQAFAALLAADATLNAWSTSLYGKVPTIYIGASLQSLPEDEHLPAIIFPAGTETGGLDAGDDVQITILFAVYREGTTTSESIVTYTGLLECEQFADHIWRIIQDITAEYSPQSRATTLWADEFYPQWPGSMDVTLKRNR